MTGLISIGNQGMTPQQLRELELRKALSAAKTGPVLPPQGTVGQAPAGLLGSDPVSTQQQSRINPHVNGQKPMYVDSAGNVGRSIPGGGGANVGYGAAAEAAEVGGKGLLMRGAGLVGRALLGPVGLGAQVFAGGSGLSDGTLPASQRLTPEQIKDAQAYAKGIRGKSKIPPTGAKLLTAGQDQPEVQQPWPDLPVATERQEPVNPNLAAEKAMLEKQVSADLESGKTSRPKLAEQAVDAKIEQTGQKVTPAERKELIKEETGFFRDMDDDTIAKYASAFMQAGGIYAAMVGDNETARTFFGQSNALTGQLADKKALAAKDKADESAAILAGRKADNDDVNTESQIKLRDAQVRAADAGVLLADGRLANEEARTGIMQQGSELDKQHEARMAEAQVAKADYDERVLKINQQRADSYAKAQSNGGKAPTGPSMTFPQNQELVKSYFKGQGIDSGKGVTEAAAQQLMNLQKNYPDLTIEEQMSLVTEQFKVNPGDPEGVEKPWWNPTGWGADEPSLELK